MSFSTASESDGSSAKGRGASSRDEHWLTVLVSEEQPPADSLARLVEGCALVVLARDRKAVATFLLKDLPREAQPSPEGPPEALCVDLHRHEVTCRGERLNVTENEFQLLAALSHDKGRAYSYEELETIIWSTRFLGDPARLRSAVKRLRAKLASVAADVDIEPVRGIGFRLAFKN